jgi:hypothetical protein
VVEKVASLKDVPAAMVAAVEAKLKRAA